MTETYEEILGLFREVAERQKTSELLLQENRQQFIETQQFLKNISQETDRKFQETDRKFQETDRKFQETDRKIKAVSTQIGQLGNRLGEFVEEMVRPAVVRLFRERKVEVNQVLRDLIAYDIRGKMLSQVDLLAVNTDTAVVIECKNQLTVDYVNEHLERLNEFKINFPQYKNFTIIGAVTGMVLPLDVSLYAYRKGLFVLTQSGETVAIHNDEKFQPRHW